VGGGTQKKHPGTSRPGGPKKGINWRRKGATAPIFTGDGKKTALDDRASKKGGKMSKAPMLIDGRRATEKKW